MWPLGPSQGPQAHEKQSQTTQDTTERNTTYPIPGLSHWFIKLVFFSPVFFNLEKPKEGI